MMSISALRGKKGQTLAFLTEGGRIISLKGKSLAWISGSNVYNYTGDHIGWWIDGHLRGPDGGVLAWQAGATNLGVIPPDPAPSPTAPVPSIEPTRPMPSAPPVRPANKSGWSDYTF
jgi:hypothetical protein